ncbi:MAG: hypothetical protein ACUVTP_09880 [Candidatus Fervidibacter sp.]|uniref:hypothetical protein n=1 Tax=Candidatus Fervidibacter sp. TaxID=3100871 RepID=UPI00404AD89E
MTFGVKCVIVFADNSGRRLAFSRSFRRARYQGSPEYRVFETRCESPVRARGKWLTVPLSGRNGRFFLTALPFEGNIELQVALEKGE